MNMALETLKTLKKLLSFVSVFLYPCQGHESSFYLVSRRASSEEVIITLTSLRCLLHFLLTK